MAQQMKYPFPSHQCLVSQRRPTRTRNLTLLHSDLRNLTLSNCTINLAQQIIRHSYSSLEQVSLSFLKGNLTEISQATQPQGKSTSHPSCYLGPVRQHWCTTYAGLTRLRSLSMFASYWGENFEAYNKFISNIFNVSETATPGKMSRWLSELGRCATKNWACLHLIDNAVLLADIETLHVKNHSKGLVLRLISASALSIQSITLKSIVDHLPTLAPASVIPTLPSQPSYCPPVGFILC